MATLGCSALAYVPISAREGTNVTVAGTDVTPWYNGPALLAALEALQVPRAALDQPLRFPIQDVYRHENRRTYVGRIESGSLEVGDQLVFLPSNKTAHVEAIIRWPSSSSSVAVAGESIAITLRERTFVERGYVASHPTQRPAVANALEAELFWIGQEPLRCGASCQLRIATQEVEATLGRLSHARRGASEGEVARCESLAFGEVANATFQMRSPLAFDNYDHVPALGRIGIIKDDLLVGGGIIDHAICRERCAIESRNLFQSNGDPASRNREAGSRSRGRVIWLTGLSGAGKSTLARAVEKELSRRRSPLTSSMVTTCVAALTPTWDSAALTAPKTFAA